VIQGRQAQASDYIVISHGRIVSYVPCLPSCRDPDADGDEEDGVEGEEEDGVDDDGGDAGVEVAEGDEARLGRHLEEQPWGEQDEEHKRDEHRCPVLHLLQFLPRFFF